MIWFITRALRLLYVIAENHIRHSISTVQAAAGQYDESSRKFEKIHPERFQDQYLLHAAHVLLLKLDILLAFALTS